MNIEIDKHIVGSNTTFNLYFGLGEQFNIISMYLIEYYINEIIL